MLLTVFSFKGLFIYFFRGVWGDQRINYGIFSLSYNQVYFIVLFQRKIYFVVKYRLLFMLWIVMLISGNPRIIHRDIKSSNILLDYNFDAQVCILSYSEFDMIWFILYFDLSIPTCHVAGLRLWASQISSWFHHTYNHSCHGNFWVGNL